jgi:hypothetical protein
MGTQLAETACSTSCRFYGLNQPQLLYLDLSEARVLPRRESRSTNGIL